MNSQPLTLRQAQGEGMGHRARLQSLMLSLSKHEGHRGNALTSLEPRQRLGAADQGQEFLELRPVLAAGERQAQRME